MSEALKNIVYSKNSVEFITVSVQYCVLLENLDETNVSELTDKLTKLLPFLYLKTSLVPDMEMLDEAEPEITVDETVYNYILNKLQNVFADNDVYLEVFLQDMKYSETPISANISEDLTDIYQDLKNCITIYERGITENMNDALHVCIENFKSYWGQKLVNVMRALHSLKYSTESQDSDMDILNFEDEW